MQWMCGLASKMRIFLHCREDTHSDSSLIQQDERTDYSTEKIEIPYTASFVDPYNPALFVVKRPLSDNEKITLLTSKFNYSSNFLPLQEGLVPAVLQILGCNTVC